jgi:hypothetical protein
MLIWSISTLDAEWDDQEHWQLKIVFKLSQVGSRSSLAEMFIFKRIYSATRDFSRASEKLPFCQALTTRYMKDMLPYTPI